MLALLGAGTALAVQQHLVGQLGRIPDSFTGLDHRPAPAGNGSENILVVAVDGPDGVFTTGRQLSPAAASTAAVLLVHFDAAGRSPTIVSIPGAAVASPPGVAARTLSDELALGSPAPLVGAVERLAGIRVDHLAAVSWATFARLDDWVGGVVLPVEQADRPDVVDDQHVTGPEVGSFLGDRSSGRWRSPSGSRPSCAP